MTFSLLAIAAGALVLLAAGIWGVGLGICLACFLSVGLIGYGAEDVR